MFKVNQLNGFGFRPILGSYTIAAGAIGSTASATSFNVPYPTGIEKGDLLLILGSQSSATPTCTGFTNFISGATNALAFSKIADGTESGNASISRGSAVFGIATMYRIRHSSGRQCRIFAHAGSFDSDGGLQNAALSASVGNGQDLIIAAISGNNPGSETTPPSGSWTDVSSQENVTPCTLNYYKLNATANFDVTFEAGLGCFNRFVTINVEV